MLLGEFEQAWCESDAIRSRGAADPHRFWQGEPIAGKRVMLRCLHGYGDAVQFLRYAPRLRAAASQLIVEVAPRLVELASCFDGVDEVVTWGEGAPAKMPEWDVQIEGNELPYLFRTQLCDLPIATKYLSLPHESRTTNASRKQTALRVGLVWTAGAWNASRSIPPKLLAPLMDVADCELWNLQGGPEAEQADKCLPGVLLRTEERAKDSIAALAETTAGLDLVISVDTLAAHLAGALGIPAWLLLQHEADWRWLHEREDSPWYPCLRLFRQPKEGDWESVMIGVRAALCERARVHSNEIVA